MCKELLAKFLNIYFIDEKKSLEISSQIIQGNIYKGLKINIWKPQICLP
jgi:hypothetical protein